MAKSNRIPFDRAQSSIVLVYSNGERYHVEAGHVIDELLTLTTPCRLLPCIYAR